MKKLLFSLLALAFALCSLSALADEARDAALEAVLDALGDDCRATYESLRANGPVGMGSRGDAARGVQQTLVEFGQDIVADGIAGAKTLGALNAVQSAFNLPASDALDAEGYAALLPRLLVLRDPDAAEALLADSLGPEYDYIRGCINQLAGRFYTARRDFIESQWGDWAARAEACARPWPGNGQIYKNSALKGGAVQLTVQVNGEAENATLVKVYTSDGDLAAALFIGGKGSATTFLPGGRYAVKDGRGPRWYGLEEAFGDEGVYEAMTFGEEETVLLAAGRGYTITVNADAVNDGAQVVGTEQAGWQGF